MSSGYLMEIRPGPWVLKLAFTALLSSAAGAQELSLDQAIEIAVERAPQTLAQRAKVEGAEAMAVAAGRLPDPELVLGVDNLPVTGEDAWSTSRDFMTMRKIGLMQAFPNTRKRASQRQRASAEIALANSEAQESALEVSRDAGFAWVSAYVAGLILDQLRELRPEIELQATTARAALSSGRSSTADALAAQAEVGELQDRLLQAEREASMARAELARWIGDDAQRNLGPAPNFDVLPATPEKLLGSLHRHASLVTFDAQRTLAESEIDLAHAEKRSDWSAELAYGDRGSAFSDMVSIEVRVGLPLFSRNRQDPLISAKRAELARLEAEREAELRMHAAQINGTLAAWEAAHKRMALYLDERLPLARQRSRAALAGLQSGTGDLAAVLASHVAEIGARQSYAELLKELGEAWVFLRFLEAQGGAP
jgi:outer membrane protein, heavy metal efflux system